MGWISTQYPKGTSVPEFFYGQKVSSTGGTDTYEKRWTWDGEQSVTVTEVAASALVERAAFYAVIRFKNRPEDAFGEWFVAVYQVCWRGREFTYKDMEESMGPCEQTCTAHVLDVADRLIPHPPLSEEAVCEIQALEARQREDDVPYEERTAIWARLRELDPDHTARAWRAGCRDRLARKAAWREVKHGDRVRFPRAIRFTNGRELDTFEFRKEGRRVYFRDPEGWGHYRISGWETCRFERVA